jgi:hypothetical protein
LTLDRPTQNQILGTWGHSPWDAQIMPWDSNDPANAPNLVSKLWYAAPQTSRERLLETSRNFPPIDFASAMLGPLTQPRDAGNAPSPAVSFGQGRWERQPSTGGAYNWGFNRLPLDELQRLKAEGNAWMTATAER